MSNGIRITFLGAAGTVTGSCHLINTGVGKILVDCGMYQGSRELEQRNYLGFGFDPSDIDFLLLTHAHIDHCGLIPRLVKFGFKGTIVCTDATKDLAHPLLLDSAQIQERDAEYSRKRNVERDRVQSHPLYTATDVETAMRRFRGVEYEEHIELSRNLSVRFRDAGHILGSASIEITVKTVEGASTIVASGDIGMPNTAILQDPKAFERADYMLLESTYGDRNHKNFGLRKEQLEAEIEEMLKLQGPLIIPSFAVGRAQTLLYYLSMLKRERNDWPAFKVYVDSPLSRRATDIVANHPECFDKELETLLRKGVNPFKAEWLEFTDTVDDSKKLNFLKGPRVVISASGMATAGRVRHHLANHLADKRASVLFVGYQGNGTLGRMLVEGVKSVKLFGANVPVNVRLTSIQGFSAHADRDNLVGWLEQMHEKPSKIFLVHGEPKALDAFEEHLSKLGYDASVAVEDRTVELPLIHSVGVSRQKLSLKDRAKPVRREVTAKPVRVSPLPDVVGEYSLTGPAHPGDSIGNRVSRYQRWLHKELADASFVLGEIENELPAWTETAAQQLTPQQSVGIVYDDILAEMSSLFLQALSSYEKRLVSSNGSAQEAADAIASLRLEFETMIEKGRQEILTKLETES